MLQKYIAFLSHDRAIKRDIQRNSTTRQSKKSLIKQGKIELRRDVKIKNYTIRNQQVAGSSPASSSTKPRISAEIRGFVRQKGVRYGSFPPLCLQTVIGQRMGQALDPKLTHTAPKSGKVRKRAERNKRAAGRYCSDRRLGLLFACLHWGNTSPGARLLR